MNILINDLIDCLENDFTKDDLIRFIRNKTTVTDLINDFHYENKSNYQDNIIFTVTNSDKLDVAVVLACFFPQSIRQEIAHSLANDIPLNVFAIDYLLELIE